jgi:hypothetical protein
MRPFGQVLTQVAGAPGGEAQYRVSPLHRVSQSPHRSRWVRSVRQPDSSIGSEQLPKPGKQASGPKLQRPSMHAMPSGETNGNFVQSWPQLPQFFGSVGVPQS